MFCARLIVSLQAEEKDDNMTAIELKAELFRQIDTLEDDEPMLTKILNYVSNLRVSKRQEAQAETFIPYTLSEINHRIDTSLHQIEEGKTITDELAKKQLEEEFEWLR